MLMDKGVTSATMAITSGNADGNGTTDLRDEAQVVQYSAGKKKIVPVRNISASRGKWGCVRVLMFYKNDRASTVQTCLENNF